MQEQPSEQLDLQQDSTLPEETATCEEHRRVRSTLQILNVMVDDANGEAAASPYLDVRSHLRQLKWDESCMQGKKVHVSLVREGAGQGGDPADVPDCPHRVPRVEC